MEEGVGLLESPSTFIWDENLKNPIEVLIPFN